MSWRAPCRHYAPFWHPQSPPIAHTVSTTHTRGTEGGQQRGPDTLTRLTLAILKRKPRTDARRRDVLALLRMAPMNNITALSLFSFCPRCSSSLLAVLYLVHKIDFPMCVTAVIVILQVNTLLLPGSETSFLV
jgi:hypothetical protein